MRLINAKKLEKELQNMIDLGMENVKVTLRDVLKEIQERETVFQKLYFAKIANIIAEHTAAAG